MQPTGKAGEQDKDIDFTSALKSAKKQSIKIQKDSLVKNWGNSFYESYVKGEFLGSGTYGTVHVVTHKQLKVKRALKAIEKPRGVQASLQQLDLLKKLDHPNILKIYEYFETPKQWLIITEYFEGKELITEVLENKHLTEKKAALITFQILKALHYVHNQKIAHRDIKAENILVRKENDGYIVKVIDWGLGALVTDKNLSRRCGTSYYMAPEVLSGDYNIQCDMWSLGVLLYAMLSGRFPFGGNRTIDTYELIKTAEIKFSSEIWREISLDAKRFILCLLHRDAKKRMTAGQALQHLWIKSNIASTDVSEVNLEQTLQRLKYFYAENKFHLIIINYIMNFIELPKQESRLKKEFELLDKNGDGTISKAELTEAYRKIYGIEGDFIVEKIFQKVDLDGSGDISYSQFVTFASNLNYGFTQEELKEAFRLFDEDNDGLIDKKQINDLLQSSVSSRSMSREYEEIISEIDLNNDGKIDFSEFIENITKAVSRTQSRIAAFSSSQQTLSQELCSQ